MIQPEDYLITRQSIVSSKNYFSFNFFQFFKGKKIGHKDEG
jgi:hypothetical protein